MVIATIIAIAVYLLLVFIGWHIFDRPVFWLVFGYSIFCGLLRAVVSCFSI